MHRARSVSTNISNRVSSLHNLTSTMGPRPASPWASVPSLHSTRHHSRPRWQRRPSWPCHISRMQLKERKKRNEIPNKDLASTSFIMIKPRLDCTPAYNARGNIIWWKFSKRTSHVYRYAALMQLIEARRTRTTSHCRSHESCANANAPPLSLMILTLFRPPNGAKVSWRSSACKF